MCHFRCRGGETNKLFFAPDTKFRDLIGHLQTKHSHTVSDKDLKRFIQNIFLVANLCISLSLQSVSFSCLKQCNNNYHLASPSSLFSSPLSLSPSYLLLMLSSLEKTTAAMLSTRKFRPTIGPEHSGHSCSDVILIAVLDL